MRPAEVFTLSWVEVAYLLKGSWTRRQESWVLNSRTCAMIGNLMQMVGSIGGGSNVRYLSPREFMPVAFRRGATDPLIEQDEARAAYERAIAQDRAKTDRTNALREKQGLPPLPYKEL